MKLNYLTLKTNLKGHLGSRVLISDSHFLHKNFKISFADVMDAFQFLLEEITFRPEWATVDWDILKNEEMERPTGLLQ